MLLIVWFYISLVVFLYVFLFYVGLGARARRHVKGSRSLPYITPASVDSLIAIEPDLYMIELSSRGDSSKNRRFPMPSECPFLNLKATSATPLAARFSFSMTPPQSQ